MKVLPLKSTSGKCRNPGRRHTVTHHGHRHLHLSTASAIADLVVGFAYAVVQLALRSAGKANEAKALHARIAELNTVLDAEYEKTAIPFTPTAAPARRKNTGRVVVLAARGAGGGPRAARDRA